MGLVTCKHTAVRAVRVATAVGLEASLCAVGTWSNRTHAACRFDYLVRGVAHGGGEQRHAEKEGHHPELQHERHDREEEGAERAVDGPTRLADHGGGHADPLVEDENQQQEKDGHNAQRDEEDQPDGGLVQQRAEPLCKGVQRVEAVVVAAGRLHLVVAEVGEDAAVDGGAEHADKRRPDQDGRDEAHQEDPEQREQRRDETRHHNDPPGVLQVAEGAGAQLLKSRGVAGALRALLQGGHGDECRVAVMVDHHASFNVLVEDVGDAPAQHRHALEHDFSALFVIEQLLAVVPAVVFGVSSIDVKPAYITFTYIQRAVFCGEVVRLSGTLSDADLRRPTSHDLIRRRITLCHVKVAEVGLALHAGPGGAARLPGRVGGVQQQVRVALGEDKRRHGRPASHEHQPEQQTQDVRTGAPVDRTGRGRRALVGARRHPAPGGGGGEGRPTGEGAR